MLFLLTKQVQSSSGSEALTGRESIWEESEGMKQLKEVQLIWEL